MFVKSVGFCLYICRVGLGGVGGSKEGLVLAGCVSWMGAIGSLETAGPFCLASRFSGIFMYAFGAVGLFFLHVVSFHSFPREERLSVEWG